MLMVCSADRVCLTSTFSRVNAQPVLTRCCAHRFFVVVSDLSFLGVHVSSSCSSSMSILLDCGRIDLRVVAGVYILRFESVPLVVGVEAHGLVLSVFSLYNRMYAVVDERGGAVGVARLSSR